MSDMVDTRHVFSSAEVIFGDLVRFVRSRSILLQFLVSLTRRRLLVYKF